MELTRRELNIMQEVLADAMMSRNKFGSITMQEIGKLYSKIRYSDYCERHGLTYEEMTEDDFMRCYFEENEE